MQWFFFPSLVAAAVVSASCGGQRTTPRTEPNVPDYRIEVRNQNFMAVTAYVYRDGFRDRLGIVEGTQTRTFTFNWVNPEVRILVDFVGSGCIRTESMAVVQGDDLLLIILAGDHLRANRSLC